MEVFGSCQNRLVNIVQDLSLARSVDRVAEIVRAAAREFAQADGATFILRENDQCLYLDEEAIAPLWKGLRFPLEACISGWSILNRQSVAILDIYKDARIPIAAYKPTFVKSLLMTPIRQKEPIGAIGVYWAETHQPSLEETQLLAALANATSVAMQNLELHAALERKVAELERASELKDQFLLMLSHELRTPMNSILGWTEILRQDSALLGAELREGLEAIHRNAQTEMRLIGDLLDTSQILAGRMGLQKSILNLSETLTAAIRSARIQLVKKSIQVHVQITVANAPVEGDADRLMQIIGNLLSNASKFTPENGEVRIALHDEGENYVLVVEDNGEGIEGELLPKIFDRFQSQSGQLTRRHGGLGLGLAIVKSLVEAHGGSITAKSAGPKQGARFEMRLPRAYQSGAVQVSR